jgi:hypothetical protein
VFRKSKHCIIFTTIEYKILNAFGMSTKIKFELEYLLKVSIKVLENSVSTPAGLAEWFADDVKVKEDVYTFVWDKSEEQARLKKRRLVHYCSISNGLNDEEDRTLVLF